jgi:hypothetical protein
LSTQLNEIVTGGKIRERERRVKNTKYQYLFQKSQNQAFRLAYARLQRK